MDPILQGFLIITCSAIILINVYLCFTAALTSPSADLILALLPPCLCLHVFLFCRGLHLFPLQLWFEIACTFCSVVSGYCFAFTRQLCGILTLRSLQHHQWAQYNLLIFIRLVLLRSQGFYHLSVFPRQSDANFQNLELDSCLCSAFLLCHLANCLLSLLFVSLASFNLSWPPGEGIAASARTKHPFTSSCFFSRCMNLFFYFLNSPHCISFFLLNMALCGLAWYFLTT